MGSVLVAMPRAEDANRIAGIVRNSGMLLDVNICDTGADVLRVANDRDYGVIICGKQLRDMGYSELIGMLPEYFGSIVLTKDQSLEVVSDNMVKLIIPFRANDLNNTISMITDGFYRRLKKKRVVPPKRNVESQKIVDQAKHMLMERNGLTEEEAVRYIQKNSMDFGRKMVESAQMILSLYG